MFGRNRCKLSTLINNAGTLFGKEPLLTRFTTTAPTATIPVALAACCTSRSISAASIATSLLSAKLPMHCLLWRLLRCLPHRPVMPGIPPWKQHLLTSESVTCLHERMLLPLYWIWYQSASSPNTLTSPFCVSVPICARNLWMLPHGHEGCPPEQLRYRTYCGNVLCLFPKYQIFILYVAFTPLEEILLHSRLLFCYSNHSPASEPDDLGICVCLAADVDISFYVCCSHCAQSVLFKMVSSFVSAFTGAAMMTAGGVSTLPDARHNFLNVILTSWTIIITFCYILLQPILPVLHLLLSTGTFRQHSSFPSLVFHRTHNFSPLFRFLTNWIGFYSHFFFCMRPAWNTFRVLFPSFILLCFTFRLSASFRKYF